MVFSASLLSSSAFSVCTFNRVSIGSQ
jgi:hypothetical protein